MGFLRLTTPMAGTGFNEKAPGAKKTRGTRGFLAFV
jgi:hypothetical protein